MAVLKIYTGETNGWVPVEGAYALRYTQQALTKEQQKQARENIGATSIIDVVELPTENIREDVLYRLLTGTFYYNGVIQNTFVCEIVNELPISGQPATNLEFTTAYTYYNISDNILYGYVDNTLSQGLNIPEGWYNAALLFEFAEVPFGGILPTITDNIEKNTIYLILEGALYEYHQNHWEELNQIGWRGSNAGAEKFNSMLNKASGDCSHAEGFWTIASGLYSHAEGRETEASGEKCHAEGFNTTASGDGSHAEGDGTTASGVASHAEGSDTTASTRNQHVQGTYNIIDVAGNSEQQGKYAHIVGNGTGPQDRSNAHTLDWQGNAWFAGDVYVGSTSGKDKDEGSKRLARIDEVPVIEISETPKDGEILVYDAATKKLVNSGYTFASLKEWIQQEINNTILNGEW